MLKADNFIESMDSQDDYFYMSLRLIIYSYIQILKSKVHYSRAQILKEAQQNSKNINKATKTKNPIEDYLRNDLVKKYIRHNRKMFGLQTFYFESGVEEFNGNIKVGILDIKMSSTELTDNDIYFIFECKRLSKKSSLISEYVKNGINRFVDKQYYPESNIRLAGMIAFAEDKQIKNRIPLNILALNKLDNMINNNATKLNLQKPIHNYKLVSSDTDIDNFEFSYLTTHLIRTDSYSIDIHHLLLDYYEILLD